MAHYHFTVKARSRRNGRSTVEQLAYRSATELKDHRNGETYYYSNRHDVFHVDILLPEDAPQWIVDIARACQTDRQSALQKLSDIFEAAEKRHDARVYREVEFSLPNELTDDQNIEWSKEFVRDCFTAKGMAAIVNYHGEIDEDTGIYKPHCHVLLSTRKLTDDGFASHKNRAWDSKDLLMEAREQYAAYQNAALERHGFDARVTHLSYDDREVDIEAQSKLGRNVREMGKRGISTDKQKIFDTIRLKNQFKIIKDPEVVFKIVTSMHTTFTRKDIAKVLNRYIYDREQFQTLLDRLMGSNQLVDLESQPREVHKDTNEAVYTTKEMIRIELNLVRQAETLAAQNTHPVSRNIVEKVVAKYHEKFKKHGGLSSDQEATIRHVLKGSQISCVVGFAGAGKTTCLEAVREAWEESGYKVLGLAPTGKAARNIEDCGIRAMTIHKFLYAQQSGRERVSDKTIIVVDEFGMVDSRRGAELLSLVSKRGTKIVPMGDGHQAQAVEAGPAFRLLTEKVKPTVLEKVVRQQIEWQRETTRLFGEGKARAAVRSYLDQGCFTTVSETLPDFSRKDALLDNFCLSRQMSGRIYQEMKEDFKEEFKVAFGKDAFFDPEIASETLKTHQDFGLFKKWQHTRQGLVERIVDNYGHVREELKEREVNVKVLDSLVAEYRATSIPNRHILGEVETILRKMSYDHIADTRPDTRDAMVKAWAESYEAAPDQTHLMLAFTNKDANKLNEEARLYMRDQGRITGKDVELVTQRIETDDFEVEYRTYHERTFAKGDRLLFTRNNNDLDVKNGSLGTIQEISRNTIKVALDTEEEEPRTLSFSPNLYPFIDNGWATTIHKSQGTTVDHTKLLAAYEQYRNLAYVGMSRHRQTLQVFASTLDFWREEKIVDRLGRVQEKLSGFDYLDSQQLQEKLTEDTDILWYHEKVQQGKDFWTAIKVTARDIFYKGFGFSHLSSKKAAEETNKGAPYLSFEDTEEIRSTDFFEDRSADKRKRPTTKEEHPGFGDGKVDGEPPPKQPSSGPSASGGNSSEHSRADEEKSASLNNDKEDKSQPETKSSPPKASKDIASPKDDLDEKIKAAIKATKEKIERDHDYKIVVKEKPLSAQEVEEQLKERMFELATTLIDKSISQNTSRELRFGKDREIRVVLSGQHKGFYHNFETGVQGGPFKLIEDQQGLSSFKEVLEYAKEFLGGSSIIIERHATVKKKEAVDGKESTWKPVVPVPKEQENPDIVNNKYLNIMLKDGWKEAARHAYRNEVGNLKGYVVRLEKANEDGASKKTPPLAYCENEKGQKAWRWQGFEKENKTPYKIEVLSHDPHKPVLVVEGEKTADAAQKLLPDYHVLTWGGGAGNVDKTNWQCLVGRTVVIWPDYDYDHTGQKAAQGLKEILTHLNKEAGKEIRISVVDLAPHLPNPKFLPDKWDLADKLPEGWNLQTVRDYLKEAIGEEIREEKQEVERIRVIPIKSKEDKQREAFEASRLELNQEWCATFGFMEQHRRFPDHEAELNATYWQGERLTAIEGRLYREALDKGGEVDRDTLIQLVRKELSENQSAPNSILTFGKASNLTEDQLKLFEQHILIHRDRTNQLPSSTELDHICQAIKEHRPVINSQVDILDIKGNTGDSDSSNTTKPEPNAVPMPELTSKPDVADPSSRRSNTYRSLVEQQAILKDIRDGREINTPLKSHEIDSFCAERISRMDKKVQFINQLNQDMKEREQNRDRGFDI